ncbi:hypothetical protein [Actinoplanes couchii]|uniref:Uncharacterized protein n=1 Tax=Actinoplanes couchii TaxID=403638 RepID=A0ABQ3X492_9ACTN|nr:hypothetical protein [Actinoplanes couchii]MDR6326425.1 hypothetical protein [Actinoplanes couchii]GID53223.1 hypothetical protein Aco03nite_016270 [Actinoplanes couchii]
MAAEGEATRAVTGRAGLVTVAAGIYRGPVEIRLWEVVAEAGALAEAGPGARVHTTADAVFAAGPEGTVMIATGVRNAEDLTVSGPFPRLIEGRLTAGDGLPLHVFARLPDGCLTLGTARVTEPARRRGVLQRLDLRLDTPLPEHLLGLAETPWPGPDWLDLLPDDPLTAMQRFAADWWPAPPATGPAEIAPPAAGLAEIAPSTLVSGRRLDPARLDERLPEALRVFQRSVAGRTGSDPLTIHRDPVPGGPGGTLVFGEAADGTFDLLMDAGADDPAVYYHGLSDQPLRERERLSRYLLLTVLAGAAMDGTAAGGMAFVDRSQARRIVAPLRRVPLRPMRWPSARSRLYAGPDTIALVGEDDADWFEVYVGTRSRSSLRRLRRLGLDWASFNETAASFDETRASFDETGAAFGETAGLSAG